MTGFINVQTEEEFDCFLADMRGAKTVVADTETNGFNYYRDNYIISISVYLPELDVAYNLPFKHGEGRVQTRWTKTQPQGTPFASMNWSGNVKKDQYLEYWFQEWRKDNPDFGNLPLGWYDRVKAVWGLPDVLYIFHNARFDLHMLEADGFPRPAEIEDTMWLLHVVCENWADIDVIAPYKYIKTDGREKAGRWVYEADGKLASKKQVGKRGLKWQAAFIKLLGATTGEAQLIDASREFEHVLAAYALSRPDNPINAGLIYKTDKGRQGQAQYGKIKSKLVLDEKSNMWMLPSDIVAPYALLDVVLTWQLREHYWPTLERWHNVELYKNICDYGYNLCWRMERNGVQIDIDNALEEIARLDVLIDELTAGAETLFGKPVNMGSPKQLMTALIEMGYNLHATDKDALEAYEDDEIIALVLERRKATKSRDTYLKNWIAGVDATGRVHPRMNPDGTIAGRLSSSGKPAGNFQNIPDRGGYTVKRAIVPYDDNWVLAALDMGQFEARLACWYAEVLLKQPLNMTLLFESGVDLHVHTAEEIGIREIVFPGMSDEAICVKLGYDLSNMQDTVAEVAYNAVRQMGKTMNFGLLYLGGRNMLAKLLRIDIDLAAILVGKWRSLFPAFKKAAYHYRDQSVMWQPTPSGDGYGMYVTQPISGRHRKLQRYPTSKWFKENGVSKQFNPQEAASNKVWNNLVQGLAGYMCLMSGLHINREYGDDVLRIFANIHDALDMYIHVDHLDIVPHMMDIMIDWDVRPGLTVALEGSIDNTWQGMKEVKNFDLWVSSKGKQGYDRQND